MITSFDSPKFIALGDDKILVPVLGKGTLDQGVASSRINDQTLYPKNAMSPGSEVASDDFTRCHLDRNC